MKTLKKTLLAAALLSTLGLGTSANANIVDLFSDPADATTQKVIDATIGGGGCAVGSGAGAVASGSGCFQEYGPGTNILGNYRDIYVESVSVTPPLAPSTSMYAGGGALNFSASAGTNGYGKVQWDGADASASLKTDGLGGADLVNQLGCGPGCAQFVADVLIADQAFEYKITVYDMDGSAATLKADTLFPVGSSTLSTYQFSWFNLGDGTYFIDGLPFKIENTIAGTTAGIDFTKIGALQFEINTNGTIAVDLALASITKEPLPEPGALALVGVGLLAAGGVGRRRKSAAKL